MKLRKYHESKIQNSVDIDPKIHLDGNRSSFYLSETLFDFKIHWKSDF